MSLRILSLALAAALLLPAHDIPADATVHAWLKPAGERVDVLLRVPLKAIRDVPFPEQQGYLDVARLLPLMPGAAKVTLLDSMEIRADGRPTGPWRIEAVQVSLPSDRSFESFATALARLRAAPPTLDDRLLASQVFLDVHAVGAIPHERAPLAVRFAFDHLASRVAVALRFELPGAPTRAFEWTGEAGLVTLDPRWDESARRFLALGVEHILSGWDHLLFLLCLVIPLRRLRDLVLVVTAFTVAHSLTLVASAYGWGPQALWFPPLIEWLIAASIVYMALENIWRAEAAARWWMAFGFGLIHGFGFSFALRETLQFAGAHLLLALLSFNVGVELGQLAVLLVMVPVWTLTRRRVPSERLALMVVSGLVAHTAWHWMMERGERLAQFPAGPPAAFALRALAVAMLAWAAIWVWKRRTGAAAPKA